MIAEHYLRKLSDRVQRTTVAENLKGMRAALDAAQSGGAESFDVVLLDLTLPDSPMEETLGALAALTMQYDAKFVVMSSLGTDDIARRALDGGAGAFLAKQDISADRLREILDEVHPMQVVASEPTQAAGSPAGSPAESPTTSVPDVRGTEANAPLAGQAPEPLDGPALASKIAHDALGWVANITFRASHLAADPAVQSSDSLMDDVASLRTSADALSSFISGARTLVNGEFAFGAEADPTTEAIDLPAWLPDTAARWKKTSRDKRLVLNVDATSTIQVRGSSAARRLSQCLSTLFQNAQSHALRGDGPIHVSLREEPSTGPNAVVTITDDGGPWKVADGSLLGTPLGTGEKGAPSAGLGLFNARRSVEAMGGALTFFERSDAPGAYGVRLVLPRA